MISADIKADAKQEIKELVAASYNVSQKYLDVQVKTDLYFRLDLGRYSIQFDIVCLEQVDEGFFT